MTIFIFRFKMKTIPLKRSWV